MRKTATAILAAFLAAIMLSGCGKVKGPRVWWDDRNQERLPDYALPADPAAPSDEGGDFVSSPSGDDLSEDNLRDYRTNLDQEEEKRKSESSLLDF